MLDSELQRPYDGVQAAHRRMIRVMECPKGLVRKLDDLPRRPGVYLLKDARQEVVYVGKAKDLRARVRSYWQRGATRGV